MKNEYYFGKSHKEREDVYLIKNPTSSHHSDIVIGSYKLLSYLNREWYVQGGFYKDRMTKLEDWEVIKYKLLGILDDS